MSWHRIKNGKIVEVMGYEDTIGMFKQLGVMPSPLTATTPEENLADAKRFFHEVLNQGNFSILDEILADDVEFSLPTKARYRVRRRFTATSATSAVPSRI